MKTLNTLKEIINDDKKMEEFILEKSQLYCAYAVKDKDNKFRSVVDASSMVELVREIFNETGIEPILDEPVIHEDANLDVIDWTDDESGLIKSMINKFGDNEHPECNDESFDYFKLKYLIEIIKTNDSNIYKNLNKSGILIYATIKNKLGLW